MGSERQRAGDDRPHFLAFVLLLASVALVVVVAFALRRGPGPEPSTADEPTLSPEAAVPAPEIEPSRAGRDTSSGSPPAAPPYEPVPADPLAERVGGDLHRLAAGGAGFTAQVAVLCDESRVRSVMAQFGAESPLHVLPSFQGQRPCFRLCWSHYADREAARRATDLPAALREIAPAPVPKAVAEVVE